MIRAVALIAAVASPAAAETLVGQDLCDAVWSKLSLMLGEAAAVSGTMLKMDGDWCVVDAPVVDMTAQYMLDWHLDRLRFRGAALEWVMDGTIPPDSLDVVVEGLRLVAQTGDPPMDWLFAAQSRPNRIDANMALAWDPAGKVLSVEALKIDFPGENLVEFSGRAKGVDLSSEAAIQTSATSFALTEADLRVQTHGLFEWYLLMPLAWNFPRYEGYEGEIEAVVAEMQADAIAAVSELPESSFSAASKAAITALIAELPNPSGVLTFALRSEAGVGPARAMGYAMSGVPDTVAGIAPFFEGVTVDLGWTHEDIR